MKIVIGAALIPFGCLVAFAVISVLADDDGLKTEHNLNPHIVQKHMLYITAAMIDNNPSAKTTS